MMKFYFLNNSGKSFKGIISEVSKKKVNITVNKCADHPKYQDLTVLLCITKREALETNIKQAVELGVNRIIFVETEYSQKFNLKDDRLDKLIESAIEQSNNPFGIECIGPVKLADIDASQFSSVLCFSTEIEESKDSVGADAIIIGPEGGFSVDDLSIIRKLPNINFIKLNTPIMRATTALPVAVGKLLKS
jgi:16S rRNA (uracil1498-N3)-methyltransferase